MLTLLSEVKFLTTRDDITIKDTDFGAFKYNDKKASAVVQHPYADGKQSYANLRDQQYILHGRKPKQIRSSIKKLEEQLKHNRIVYCAWSDNVVMQMLLSNGLLIHICINIFTGDIIRMAFDRFFVGKLISESITDVIITRMHILISYDVNQLTFVYLQKPNLKRSAPEKISRMDPKIFNIIINGPQTRKISRHMACNNSYDLLAVWTKSSQNEVYPWRPTVRDQDRANVHIYKLSRNKLDLLCYCWTENDPINVEFSKMNHNQLRSVEQRISRKGEVTIEICVYEINKSRIQRASVTSIPLQSQVCCHSFSPDNEKLMLGCIDGSVVLFDEGRGITHLIKAAFIPTLVSWHADSAIVIIANEKCQIQCFDISLACLRSQLISEDMTPVSVLDLCTYFAAQPSLLQICCSKKPDLAQFTEKYIQADSFVLLLFENGPMAMLRLFGGTGLKGDVHTSGFTADVLIHQYLNLNNVEKAINVLLCLNWDSYGAMCLMSLHKIANFIFKQPLMPEREVQLQKALGSFHVPVKPLCEETELEFGDQIRDITRKFFQYLLRYRSYEKAFNLAIDIADEDLFMDLHNCAKADGMLELATDAYQKAEELLTRSDSRLSSHSTCSRESCSACDTTSSADESEKSWIDSKDKRTSNSTKANHDSLKSVQNTNSEIEKTSKYRKNEKISKLPQAHLSSNANNLSKARFNIPKPELKVSNYSKNVRSAASKLLSDDSPNKAGNTLARPISTHKPNISRSTSEVNFSEMRSSSGLNKSKLSSHTSFSTDYVNQISGAEPIDHLKYQQSKIEKIPRPLPRVPLSTTSHLLKPIPRHHHVIDVVPKPMNRPPPPPVDWDVPDQTLGIPITNATPILDLQYISSANDPAFNYQYRQTVLLPSHMQQMTSTSSTSTLYPQKSMTLSKTKSLHNIPATNTMPQIIHHPLVSGHIPPTFHSSDNYLIKKQMPLDAPPPLPLPPKPTSRFNGTNAVASTSILSTSLNTQPNTSQKKESGEKNKVKFSDTVTVAVVPDIPRRDKSAMERTRKSNSNGFHPLVMDPRRELADSLPLCHPHDDYLKDFQPMSLQDDQQPSSSSSNVKEGVLTWV